MTRTEDGPEFADQSPRQSCCTNGLVSGLEPMSTM